MCFKKTIYGFLMLLAFELYAVAVPGGPQIEVRDPLSGLDIIEPPPALSNSPSTGANGANQAVQVKTAKDNSENEISLKPLIYPKTFPELMIKSKLTRLTKKYCRKYRGKYIGHYSEIYLVKNCERRLLEDPDSHFKLTQRGTKIHSVDPKVVAAIPIGKAMESIQNRRFKGCRHYERKYITYRDVDVYYVKKCRKLLLPTWESFLVHRKKYGKGVNTIIKNVSWEEFIGLEEGDMIDAKVIAKLETRKLESAIEPYVDVIPISQACKGLNRTFVSFYSRIYKIENCKKREIESAAFSRKYQKVKPRELTSDQWISLPDGKEIKL
jgi:hypothetical protein